MSMTLSPSSGSAVTLECVERHEVGAWKSAKKRQEYAGADGRGILDMGRRERLIRLEGFIPDAVSGATTGAAIEELRDDVLYTLATGIGSRSFPNCELIDARTHDWTKVKGGTETQSCRYTIELVQIREGS